MSLVFSFVATLVSLAPQGDSQRASWTISADWIYTAAGAPIEGGLVTVSDGKVRSVSSGGGGELKCFAVTPGLIDLSSRIERDWNSVEQSREVTPELRIADSIDWFAEAWDREARSGVTTTLVNFNDRNVIGGMGVVVKTAGTSPVTRTVKADSVLYGAIGSAPSSSNHPAFGRPDDFYSRRPTTRMGVEWEWRRALYDAAAAARDKTKQTAGTAELQKALAGEFPLMIQAWTTQDIRTAVFLKEEMEREGLGAPRLIVDAAAEAWREPELLIRTQTAVVLPPHAVLGRTGEGSFFALDTAHRLDAAGLLVALSGHGSFQPSQRLAYQPGFAMRGGMSFEAALKTVTINPARMVGIDQRVGSLESGKDADLALWSGKPFEPSSAVIGVLIDGRLILDPRQENK